ncbi:hypothetical protein EX30DRAFT_363111 [Ascodesmis nigricans]|uniref:NADP-dependent oxidoreductase domain-containing protein n=1 Tax=Ascodesmis nigricans TaxID=341454 RepID=A0A4S2N112_9PEZI|nr:hypothetical protein EX30DRAFT_363111 [Ascodesmis nigricans]
MMLRTVVAAVVVAGKLDFLNSPAEAETMKSIRRDGKPSSPASRTSTAHFYGDSKSLLSRWFLSDASIRAHIFLSTKIGLKVVPRPPTSSNIELPSTLELHGEKKYVDDAVQMALTRLVVEVIDILYLQRTHRRAHSDRGDDDRVDGMGREGEDQVEYSPFAREIEENGVLDAARELGIAVVAYSPLGKGLLTGRFKRRQVLQSYSSMRGSWRSSRRRVRSINPLGLVMAVPWRICRFGPVEVVMGDGKPSIEA